MMNQKRGLTDSVSCPTMEIPGNPEQKKKNKKKTNKQTKKQKKKNKKKNKKKKKHQFEPRVGQATDKKLMIRT